MSVEQIQGFFDVGAVLLGVVLGWAFGGAGVVD